MSTTTKMTKTALAVALATTLGSQGVYAEEAADKDSGLEVIMVTAQKRVQNVKEVPISMSAVNQEKLLENNISNTEELSAYIANFSVSESGQGYNVIMRGLGSGANQGFEQTVGTFVDGIYRGRGHLMRSAFFDLERVEVLRGPQSALFGKNTTAGALNLTSAKPTEDLQGYINTSYDFTFGETTVEGAVSNSLTDNLQGRIALKLNDGGGFQTNTLTGEDEVQHETYNARLTLAWQPTSDINVIFSAQHDKDKLKGYAPSQAYVAPDLVELAFAPGMEEAMAPIRGILDLLKDYEIDDKSHKADPSVGELERATFEADHLTLNVEYDMGDVMMTSITGYQSYLLDQTNDADMGALNNVYRDLGIEDFTQISQEIRFTSAYDGPFNYIAGLYYQETELDYDEVYRVYPIFLDGAREFDTESDTKAAFAQFNYEFSKQWELTAGLRYSIEDKKGIRNFQANYINTDTAFIDYADPVFPGGPTGPQWAAFVAGNFDIMDHNLAGERTEKSFTPSVNLKYKLDDMMFYGSVSTGAKAGGFDARANNNSLDGFEFEDEAVTSYEVGAKFTLDDGLADINVAVFNMVFEDLQTSVFDGNAGFFVKNGAEATTRGVELDGRWAFADNWLLTGSLGLLDFEWGEFTGAKCFASTTLTSDNVQADGSCDLSGETNAFAPDLSGSMALEYYTEISDLFELKASLDLLHKSDYYTSADLNPWTKQDAYTKVNARISLLDINGTWQVALLGKNLTDETTLSFTTDMSLMPTGFHSIWVEEGRSISMQFSYNFE
ncbi:TonB-dependent receptor [Thalassotalea sp. PLHSN55]|uniref:TonB-dependent receptor n=1 Tax=Thalassotalea sp. PLHSN55 TaxID=3435888 RepID=UPI003F829D01